jgi:fibronectin-binding autotransporter adhesin
MHLRSRSIVGIAVAVCVALFVAVAPARAQTYTWNATGGVPGLGGSGTWDTVTANWNDQTDGSGNQVVWPNTTSTNAAFNSATSYTVTLSSALNAGNVNINFGNVTFSNSGNFTLTSSLFNVASGTTVSIDGASFFKSGTTALNVDGSLTINAGPGSGRLVTLTGGGTLTANGGIRIAGNTAAMVFSGNLVDFNTGANQRLAINMNASSTGTVLRLSGNNSGATGDFLISSSTGQNNNVMRFESANAISPSSVLRIEGGTGVMVELAAADLARTTNNTAGSAGGGFNLTGQGGFAALGADRNVTLVGGGTIVWTTQGFNPAGVGFQFGDANATNKLVLTNAINLNGGTTAVTRQFNVVNGTGMAAGTAAGELAGLISDNGTTQATLQINGTGRLLITNAANSFGGQLTINGPAVRVTNAGALGATTGTVFINGATGTGVLELTNGITVAKPFQIQGRTLSPANNAPALLNVSGNNTLTGTITGQTNGSIYSFQSDSGTFTIQNGFTTPTTGMRVLRLGGAGDGVLNGTLTGPNTSTPMFQYNKYGTGTWTLGGTVTLSGGPGVPGEVTPTGNSIDVQGGKLLINSAFTANGSSTIAAVESAATLGGTGNVGGAVTVKSGGALAPGISTAIGTLTAGSGATFATGSTFQAKLGANSPSGSSDMIQLTSGTVNFQTNGGTGNATIALGALGFTGSAGGSAHYTLVNTGGGGVAIDGTAQTDGTVLGEYLVGSGNINGRPVQFDVTGLSGLASNDLFQLLVNGTNLDLVYTTTAVPEPSWMLACAGIAGLGWRRWNRKAIGTGLA